MKAEIWRASRRCGKRAKRAVGAVLFFLRAPSAGISSASRSSPYRCRGGHAGRAGWFSTQQPMRASASQRRAPLGFIVARTIWLCCAPTACRNRYMHHPESGPRSRITQNALPGRPRRSPAWARRSRGQLRRRAGSCDRRRGRGNAGRRPNNTTLQPLSLQGQLASARCRAAKPELRPGRASLSRCETHKNRP